MRIALFTFSLINSAFFSLATPEDGWQDIQIPDVAPVSSRVSPPVYKVIVNQEEVAKIEATVILSSGRFFGWWWTSSEKGDIPVKISQENNRVVKVHTSSEVSLILAQPDQESSNPQ